uniref:Adenylate kinase isoenzyme 6 homolog n=1 Tax=Parastrongyloides trichosuri TaxID=131310 RepID=A0A0N4ZXE7_PARTI
MTQPRQRTKVNILVTGTPGVGKTSFSQKLGEDLGFEVMNIGELVKENQLYSSYDNDYKSYILDEDQVLDFIEDRMNSKDGGVIVDHHGCDFFPQRYFNIIIVLRCNNTILYERLEKRNYHEKKIRENIECEIFGTILEEAKDSYEEHRIFEFVNETEEDQKENLQKVKNLLTKWKED